MRRRWASRWAEARSAIIGGGEAEQAAAERRQNDVRRVAGAGQHFAALFGAGQAADRPRQ